MVPRIFIILLFSAIALVAVQSNSVAAPENQVNNQGTAGVQNRRTTGSSRKISQLQKNKKLNLSQKPAQATLLKSNGTGGNNVSGLAVPHTQTDKSNNTAQSSRPQIQGQKGVGGSHSSSQQNNGTGNITQVSVSVRQGGSYDNTTRSSQPQVQGQKGASTSRPAVSTGQKNGTRTGTQVSVSGNRGGNSSTLVTVVRQADASNNTIRLNPSLSKENNNGFFLLPLFQNSKNRNQPVTSPSSTPSTSSHNATRANSSAKKINQQGHKGSASSNSSTARNSTARSVKA
ncbi:unnamed protein product [Adineta ricciae]|uniref:Uncharacterized protein n=1 Tax=Adineta ricciae TaxID=249248 RepID=A0A813MH08_ADIRI|nr:unnamed protein product [Adineta ricciae]CAF1582744.1 unnamed protein product [Adineta ricciae]